MKCVDCPDYQTCRRQNDLRRKRHKCKKANKPFLQTNADRIRAMSDEELARYLVQSSWDCNDCVEYERLDGHPLLRDEKCDEHCAVHCLDWLRQLVKDGDNE